MYPELPGSSCVSRTSVPGVDARTLPPRAKITPAAATAARAERPGRTRGPPPWVAGGRTGQGRQLYAAAARAAADAAAAVRRVTVRPSSLGRACRPVRPVPDWAGARLGGLSGRGAVW